MRRIPVHVRVEHPADVRAALARGASRFEVALRPGSLAEADYRIARLRARAGARAPLGIDASAAGWDVDEARRALRRLAAYAPAWVIDPVPPTALSDLGPTPTPVVVDLSRADVDLAGLRARGVAGVLLDDAGGVAAVLAAGLRAFVPARAGDATTNWPPGVTLLLRTSSGPVDLHHGDLVLPARPPFTGRSP